MKLDDLVELYNSSIFKSHLLLHMIPQGLSMQQKFDISILLPVLIFMCELKILVSGSRTMNCYIDGLII